MPVLRAKVGGQWIDVPMAASGGTTGITMEQAWPAGSIRVTIANTADQGWLLFGQTVANAQTLYPALWLVVPTAWKSGSSLVIPSDVDCGLRGSSAAGLGAVSGTNVKTIATANLPAHAHPVNVTSGYVSADHTHGFTTGTDSVNHSHAGVDHLHYVSIQSGGQSADHYHMGSAGQPTIIHAYGTGIGYAGGGGQFGAGGTHWTSGDHSHGINGWSGAMDRGAQTSGVNTWHQHSGATGGISANHNHAINSNTDNTGSGTALNVQDAAINVRFQIKAH